MIIPTLNLPPQVPEDNTSHYIIGLTSVVQHADPDAKIVINHTPTYLSVVITPNPDFRQDIITNVLQYHKNLQIKPIFSKSTKIQKTIAYQIPY